MVSFLQSSLTVIGQLLSVSIRLLSAKFVAFLFQVEVFRCFIFKVANNSFLQNNRYAVVDVFVLS